MWPMPEIWGKKCLFYDVLVGDCFASIVGVHSRSYKEKKSVQLSFLVSIFKFRFKLDSE